MGMFSAPEPQVIEVPVVQEIPEPEAPMPTPMQVQYDELPQEEQKVRKQVKERTRKGMSTRNSMLNNDYAYGANGKTLLGQ